MFARRSSRSVLLAIAVSALLGTLLFLFAKTQTGDYRAGVETLALLGELHDLDNRWDMDALRLANDLVPPPAATPDRSRVEARIFQELGHSGAGYRLDVPLAELRAGMAEKRAAMRALEQAHERSLDALAAAREAFVPVAAAAAVAREGGSDSTHAAALLAARLEELRGELGGLDIDAPATSERAVERRVAALVPPAAAADAKLAEPARKAQSAARAFLDARSAEHDAWEAYARLTAGAKIERSAQSLSLALARGIDESDRWRAYLFAYAAALAVGVLYLGVRVAAAQAALRRANAELERRVTERTRDLARTLKQLQESEAQLVQTEKMSSLGQLVAGVVHEINTPLAYVKNSVATVRERMPELRATLTLAERLLAMLRTPEPDPRALHTAFDILSARLAGLAEHRVLPDLEALTHDGLHGIEQIAELVTNLRNFSRLDRSRVASFDVNEGVEAALVIAKAALRRIEVEKRLGDVPPITCSPSQVNQVILNLVTNAAQAMDKPQARLRVATRSEGPDFVAIEVADNGKGISPEALPRIFDPFFTTKEAGKGTGLGLSIAYKIVSQHGGRIDVRSEPGAGATFTVTLPIEPPAGFSETLERPEAIAA